MGGTHVHAVAAARAVGHGAQTEFRMTDVDVGIAHLGALAAGGRAGRLQALLVINGRHERARKAAEQVHEGRQRAEIRAPLAQHHQLDNKHRRNKDEPDRRVAMGEGPPNNEHGGKRQTHGAHQAEHRESEDRRRKQGPTEHRMARVHLTVMDRLALAAGAASVAAPRHLQARQLLLRDGLDFGALLLLELPTLLGRAEEVADAVDEHGRAQPRAEGATEHEHEGGNEHQRHHSARDHRLRGDHGAEGAQRAQHRERVPTEAGHRAHTHPGDETGGQTDRHHGPHGAQPTRLQLRGQRVRRVFRLRARSRGRSGRFHRFVLLSHGLPPLGLDGAHDNGTLAGLDRTGGQRQTGGLAGTAAIALVTVNFNYGSNHRSKLL